MVEFTTEKLKGLMAEKGLKQIDLAVELNIDLGTVNRKMNGKNDFNLAEIKQLARFLNVDFIITNKEEN